jgi:predicted lipoprotein
MKRTFALAVLLSMAANAVTGCKIATVRRLDDQNTGRPSDSASAQEEGQVTPFDAAAAVAAAWDSDLLPAIARARDVTELGANDGAGLPVVVRGRGRVVEANVRSRAGTATIELAGGQRAVVQVGPVLTGTAIRDALPSLGFDRFVNQIQHADVGNELNARVEQQLLQRFDRARLVGAYLSFSGMAQRDGSGVLTITPLRLALEEQR